VTTAASRGSALIEVVAVTAVAFLIREVLRRFGAGIGSGAVSTIVTLALATWLLRRRGQSWGAIGFRRPLSLRTTAAWTVGLLLADMLLVPLATSILGTAFHLPTQHLESFADLRGNTARYLLLLIPISWGTAAFGEELLFRGFLARRLADAFGGSGRAELAAAVGQATLFGLGHAYLGPRGMLNAGGLGLLAGLCYRWNGRNLWPLIVAHGLVDSVGMTVLYLGMQHS